VTIPKAMPGWKRAGNPCRDGYCSRCKLSHPGKRRSSCGCGCRWSQVKFSHGQRCRLRLRPASAAPLFPQGLSPSLPVQAIRNQLSRNLPRPNLAPIAFSLPSFPSGGRRSASSAGFCACRNQVGGAPPKAIVPGNGRGAGPRYGDHLQQPCPRSPPCWPCAPALARWRPSQVGERVHRGRTRPGCRRAGQQGSATSAAIGSQLPSNKRSQPPANSVSPQNSSAATPEHGRQDIGQVRRVWPGKLPHLDGADQSKGELPHRR